jgi:tRNA A-37 threonylcarbamoyl transferase component Bud32
VIISDNGISRIVGNGVWVYKTQPKFMTDNEIWCLRTLYPSGYVPYAEQTDIETIRLHHIEQTPVTDIDLLAYHFDKIPKALEIAGIRHGDLTRPNILIRDNHPYLIDFSESRLECDPRPSKRREGDEYWLRRTLDEIAAIA